MFFNEKKNKFTAKQFGLELERLEQWIKDSVSPFTADTKERQEARVRRAREDQDFFNETYLPHYFNDPSPQFHRDMEAIEDTGAAQQRPVAIAAPRGFSKSTRITFARRLKRALYKESKFIIIFGADADLAKTFTVSIRSELDINPRIAHDFGRQKSRDWAADAFVLKSGTKIMSMGTGESPRGLKHGPHRPDDIVMDDLETNELVRNPKRVKDLLAWVNDEVLPAVDPKKSNISWVGTILAKKSALAQIMANTEWISRIFVGIKDPVWNPQSYYDTERDDWVGEFVSGEPLWPERFGLKVLSAKRRLFGASSFKKEIMNDPDDGEGMFRREWIRRVPLAVFAEPGVAVYTAGRDPSVKHGESNDYKAHVTVARVGARLIARYASIKRISISAMVLEDFDLYRRFMFRQLGLEVVAFQELLRDYYNAEAEKQRYFLPVVPIPRTVAKDSEMRIGGLAPAVEAGTLAFAEGPSSEIGDMEELIEQLISFPSTTVHDDGPDALETAYHLAQRVESGRPSYETVVKRAAQFGAGAF